MAPTVMSFCGGQALQFEFGKKLSIKYLVMIDIVLYYFYENVCYFILKKMRIWYTIYMTESRNQSKLLMIEIYVGEKGHEKTEGD